MAGLSRAYSGDGDDGKLNEERRLHVEESLVEGRLKRKRTRRAAQGGCSGSNGRERSEGLDGKIDNCTETTSSPELIYCLDLVRANAIARLPLRSQCMLFSLLLSFWTPCSRAQHGRIARLRNDFVRPRPWALAASPDSHQPRNMPCDGPHSVITLKCLLKGLIPWSPCQTSGQPRGW